MIAIRNEKEIAVIAQACKISAQALKLAGDYMKEGITTAEIDDAIRKFIVESGAKPSFLGYGGYPASACISVNNQVIHGIPSRKTVLKNGDVVSVDVGAFYNGYHGDNAFTYMVGNVDPQAQKLLEVTQKCLELGIQAAKPGNRTGDIGNAVQTYAEQFGYGVVRKFVGHGVGSNLHEDPEVPNFGMKGRGPRLVPGMVIAIEPMINLVGSGVKMLNDGWTVETESGTVSAHFEHTVVITNDGCKILTQI